MDVKKIQLYKTIRTALLITGSAFFICSCGRGNAVEEDTHEGLMTQEAHDLTIIESTNGKLAQRFESPLVEVYEYAREPYREFRKGIKITTFDSETNEIESTLVADYAIHFLDQQLWEAKGNVVATNAQGHVLETQQLFWNQRTERIYSNIDSKITQGSDVIIGSGFESDEQFKDWEFRRPRGTVDVDVESTKTHGSGATDEDAVTDGESAEDTADPSPPTDRDEPEQSPQQPAVADPAPDKPLRRPSSRRAPAETVEAESLTETRRIDIGQDDPE